MNAADKPGIAVWGVGTHARRNLIPAIASSSSWRLAGLLSRNWAVAQSVATPLGVKVYEAEVELLDDPSVAAVLLAGPNGVHYSQTKKVLGAGKAALVEKSFCETYDQAAELTALARRQGVLVAECFSYLHHPQFEQLKASLSASGRIMSLTARFGFPFRDPSDIRYRRDLAGGALLDVGAYCLSAVARLVAGPVTVKWSHLVGTPGYEVDTGGQAVVETGQGVVGLCDWGFGRAYRNEVEVWSDSASIFAERLFAKPADLRTDIRIVHQQDNRRETVAVAAGNSFAGMLEAMATALADAQMQAVLRDDILVQAALIRDVRDLAER